MSRFGQDSRIRRNMILEKRSVLLILALRFLCAFCDNDDASAARETTIVTPTGSSSDFESTEKSVTSSMIHDPGSTLIATSNDDLDRSTENSSSTANHESTITEIQTTDSTLETDTTDGTPSSTIAPTTELVTTTLMPEDTTPADDSPTICDPSWLVNASEDARKVFNLTMEDRDTEWIAFSWEPPCRNATDQLVYLVERHVDGDKNYSRTEEIVTRHNATDLDPCTQYTFTVKVITKNWTSDGSNLTATTDYGIADIENVWDLAHNVSVNVIELGWKAPEVHARCVSNYSITWCNGKSSLCNEIVVNATSYHVSDLEPCTEYLFTIKTVTPTVESIGVNYTAKTTSPRLLPPRSPKVTPGSFSLTVEWEPPESNATCLKHYRVSIEPNVTIDNTFNTTETNMTIARLHACRMYQVHVIAVNENDEDGDVLTVDCETLHYKTNPPTSHGIALANTNNISIIWTVNKENNHCLVNAVITVCNCTARNGTGYDGVDGVSEAYVNSKNTSIIVSTVVTDLSPFTSYVCSAFTVAAEASDRSDLIYITTSQDVPSEPIVFAKNNSDSWFFLAWDPPARLPGILAEFEITFQWEPLYPVPPWCTEEEPTKPVCLDGLTRTYNYTKAKASANYTVWMRARTSAGWSPLSEPQTLRTDNGVPGAITKMSAPIIRPSPSDPNVLDTILIWGLPCSLNGQLAGFNVSVHGTRAKNEDHNFVVMHNCTEYIINDHMCSTNLKELKGEYNYTFEISAKVSRVDTGGPPESRTALYPAGIPPQPNDDYIQKITFDPFTGRRSTTTATVLLPFFFNTNGDIKYYAVMVAMAEHNKPSRTRFNLITNDTWPDTSAWREAMTSDFAIAYQATWKKWNPYPDQIADYGQMRVIKYTVGEDVSCKDISFKTDKPMYCNGPLKPDTWYHVRMRAFTNGGYTDSDVFVIKTNSELDLALVIGGIFGILVVGILVTMMLLVRKCSPYIVLRRFLHSDMPGSPVPAPFTRKKFISHCQQLIDNPGKLSNEFRLLQTLSVDLQMPTNTACLQANRKKNRYSDILPYDFSRVKLEVIDNDPNTDYINASFIRGYTGEDEYIACQGPKEETTYDFWRMVDQYNINIVVMLTQLVEKGKEKCHQYYPTIRETFRYENMTIRCTSELDYRTHTQRTLVLQKENKKRNITHLHFKDWPDHDVPEDFDAMINFCQIIRRNISANKGFIVVHCSAGIGRTGTLITIDILLQHLRDNRKLDVFGTVYRLRHHRINMVQRESQYAYIYNCIKQVLKNPYFLKTYKPPPVDPVYEKAGISKNTKDTKVNSDMNLVNNLEILNKYSAPTESSESICNSSSQSAISSTARHQKSATISGLRHYKSMGVINVKTRHITLGRSRTLDCVFYKSLRGSSYELNTESVTQESLPLLICSRSAEVLDDSVQSADGQHMRETIEL